MGGRNTALPVSPSPRTSDIVQCLTGLYAVPAIHIRASWPSVLAYLGKKVSLVRLHSGATFLGKAGDALAVIPSCKLCSYYSSFKL